MTVKLSVSNFFKYFVIHPRSQNLSKRDRNKATICSLAAILLFGIPHLIAKVKKFKLQNLTPSSKLNSISEVSSTAISSKRKQKTSQSNKSLSKDDTVDFPNLKEKLTVTGQLIEERLALSKKYKAIKAIGKAPYSRKVGVVKSETQQTLLFVKRANPGLKFTMKNDAIAYLIDQVFNFGVVPPTLLVKRHTSIDTTFIQDNLSNFRFPLILQMPVEHEERQQIHQKKNFDKGALDSRQIQKAILFNIITGKHDGRPDNTIVDKDNRVFEIDNEQIGRCKTDSWMLREYSDLIFDQDIIEHVTDTPESLLAEVFELFEEEYKLTLEQGFKDNILNNLRKVCQFFKDNGTIDIKVQDLIFN